MNPVFLYRQNFSGWFFWKCYIFCGYSIMKAQEVVSGPVISGYSFLVI